MTRYQQNLSLPISPLPVDSANIEANDFNNINIEILNSTPQNYKTYVELLITRFQNNGINWNSKSELNINGKK